MNASLKFEIPATWNCKRVTPNYSWRLVISHEKPDANGLYFIKEWADLEGVREGRCAPFYKKFSSLREICLKLPSFLG